MRTWGGGGGGGAEAPTAPMVLPYLVLFKSRFCGDLNPVDLLVSLYYQYLHVLRLLQTSGDLDLPIIEFCCHSYRI